MSMFTEKCHRPNKPMARFYMLYPVWSSFHYSVESATVSMVTSYGFDLVLLVPSSSKK